VSAASPSAPIDENGSAPIGVAAYARHTMPTIAWSSHASPTQDGCSPSSSLSLPPHVKSVSGPDAPACASAARCEKPAAICSTLVSGVPAAVCTVVSPTFGSNAPGTASIGACPDSPYSLSPQHCT